LLAAGLHNIENVKLWALICGNNRSDYSASGCAYSYLIEHSLYSWCILKKLLKAKTDHQVLYVLTEAIGRFAASQDRQLSPVLKRREFEQEEQRTEYEREFIRCSFKGLDTADQVQAII
jgi:hypothetical protein